MAERNSFKENLKVYIWHPTIEHLQYFTWMALQSLLPMPITFVLGYWENEVRKAQKWKMLDLDELHPILIPPQKLWREGTKLLRENSEAVHVFQAFRGAEGYNYFPLIMFALRRGMKVVVLDEPYSNSPVGYFSEEHPWLAHFKTRVRPFLRQAMGKLLYAVSLSQKPCIMSLSLIAKQQFIKAGFDPDTVFPFGYFVPRQATAFPRPKEPTDLRLIFVGALISRKGLDILMRAVQSLQAQGYRLTVDIFGSGSLDAVHTRGLPVRYQGTVPFDQIQAAIAEHDLLVLPSRHDGWGVVVNEALLQGIPVIVSSRVGAKCLLEASGAGLVFESESASDLAEKLKCLLEDPGLLEAMRTKAQKVSQDISPEKGAQYFLDVLGYYFYRVGTRPSAIWAT